MRKRILHIIAWYHRGGRHLHVVQSFGKTNIYIFTSRPHLQLFCDCECDKYFTDFIWTFWRFLHYILNDKTTCPFSFAGRITPERWGEVKVKLLLFFTSFSHPRFSYFHFRTLVSSSPCPPLFLAGSITPERRREVKIK